MAKGAKLSKRDSISSAIMAVIIPPNWKINIYIHISTNISSPIFFLN